jgi:hypothetical protein
VSTEHAELQVRTGESLVNLLKTIVDDWYVSADLVLVPADAAQSGHADIHYAEKSYLVSYGSAVLDLAALRGYVEILRDTRVAS